MYRCITGVLKQLMSHVTRCSEKSKEVFFGSDKSSGSVCACAGSGEIDWKQLSMVVGSEMLKFEQEQAAASEAGKPGADDLHLYASPRGNALPFTLDCVTQRCHLCLSTYTATDKCVVCFLLHHCTSWGVSLHGK